MCRSLRTRQLLPSDVNFKHNVPLPGWDVWERYGPRLGDVCRALPARLLVRQWFDLSDPHAVCRRPFRRPSWRYVGFLQGRVRRGVLLPPREYLQPRGALFVSSSVLSPGGCSAGARVTGVLFGTCGGGVACNECLSVHPRVVLRRRCTAGVPRWAVWEQVWRVLA
jgi:hypothetical protein